MADGQPETWQAVGPVEEFRKRKCHRLRVASGKDVAVFYIDEKFFATSAICPHAKGPLDQGDIEDLGGGVYQVICPSHAYTFNLVTGASPGTTLKLATYPTEVRDGQLFVQYTEALSLKVEEKSQAYSVK